MKVSDQHLSAPAPAPRPGIEVEEEASPRGPGTRPLQPAFSSLVLRVPFHFSAAVNQKPQMEHVGKTTKEAR